MRLFCLNFATLLALYSSFSLTSFAEVRAENLLSKKQIPSSVNLGGTPPVHNLNIEGGISSTAMELYTLFSKAQTAKKTNSFNESGYKGTLIDFNNEILATHYSISPDERAPRYDIDLSFAVATSDVIITKSPSKEHLVILSGKIAEDLNNLLRSIPSLPVRPGYSTPESESSYVSSDSVTCTETITVHEEAKDYTCAIRVRDKL